jgi:hypothetical protein
LNDHVVQMPKYLAEADAHRWSEKRRHERWRVVLGLLAMLLGGFLAGEVASYRSGVMVNAKPAAAEEATSKKGAPLAPRRPVGSSAKPGMAAR